MNTPLLVGSPEAAPFAQFVVSSSVTLGGFVVGPGTMSHELPLASTKTVSPFQYLPASML